MMKDLEKILRTLTDHLGDGHDFAELRSTLTISPKLTEGAAARPSRSKPARLSEGSA